MKKILSTIAILGLAISTQAQVIKGVVQNEKNEAMPGSNVMLLQAKDSAVLKYSFAEADGAYLFEGIAAGSYLIKAEDYNSQGFYSTPFTFDGKSEYIVPPIHTQTLVQSLEGVVVQYKRPIIELKPDKTIFNVDSTINATGQTALELMRKSPGVLVDKDENLFISGKTGVKVYIDGRPSPLTGQELAQYLKNIPSSSIDLIEIINNPSAKYDAEGNAGIINIRLKKNQNIGTNGSVNLGYAQGVFAKYNAGINLNHKTEKTNTFLSYNYGTGNRWNEAHFFRDLNDTSYQKAYDSRSPFNSHNYKAGLDYYLSGKSILGFMVNGNIADHTNYSNEMMDIIYAPSNTVVRKLMNNNTASSSSNDINGNINYAYNDKNSGKSLTIDADYGKYKTTTEQYQPNIYLDAAGNEIQRNENKIMAPTKIVISSLKADWEQNLGAGKLGLGAKVAFVKTENDYTFQQKTPGGFVTNALKSNEFNYQENIQAVYGQYSRQFKGLALTAGLRFENTHTEGNSIGLKDNGTPPFVTYDTTFTRDYFNFFPSVGLTFNKNPMNQFTLAYSKRMDRPNYGDINPFEFQMDDYTYQKGNIKLLPMISHNFSITHSYKYMLNTKLEYSRINNVFAELLDTAGSRLFQTKANLATQDMISLNISYPFMYRKLSTFFNLNAYYAMYKADYGAGRKINLDVFSFNFYGQASYPINSWLSTEISGWYTAPSIWQGTFKSDAMGGIDIGAQARILQGKGTLKLSVGDVFHTMQWGGRSSFVNQNLYAYGRWESTQARLNFTYNFGNAKIKSRNRTSGAEEEKGRTGSSQGLGQGGK